MPTFTTVDAAWTPSPAAFDDAEARRFDTAMFLGDGSANGVRGGIVRHGDNSLAVTVNGSDQVTVQPGAFVIPAPTGLGVYRGALAAAVGPTAATAITPRNATNPRIDLVTIHATGTAAEVKTIDGTPGASPSAPALPAQHIELARITVPAVGGGAVTVDSTWRAYATGLGGTLYVETSARLPGSGNQKGQRAVALNTGAEHIWSGTAWIETGAWQNFTPNFPGLPISPTARAGRYVVLDNKTVIVRAYAKATGAAGATISMDLPVAGAVDVFPATTYNILQGNVMALNTGVGTNSGQPNLTSATQVQFVNFSGGAPWGATVPHTWKDTDEIRLFITYERG